VIKKILLVALLSTAYTTSYSLTSTYESRTDDALTCTGVFYILTSIAEPKGLNQVFAKLTRTMQMIYGSLDFIDSNHSLTYGELAEAKDKESLRLGKLYDIDSEAVVNEYVQCNAWRADIAKQIQENESSEEIIKNPPVSRSVDSINISKDKRDVYRSQLATAMKNWDSLGRLTSQDLKSQIRGYLKESISSQKKASLKKYRDFDKDNSSPWFSSAKKGNAKAQFKLGHDYLLGVNKPKSLNKEEGIKWWREYGKKEGIKWILKSANQGFADAQYGIGHRYYFGQDGIKKDVNESIKWFYKAASQGQPEAQYALGMAYEYGKRGVNKDGSQAFKWYRKAANQEHSKSQTKMGEIYSSGVYVLKDYEKAIQWYRKAAKQGSPYGQLNLGKMYIFGTGTLENKPKAKYWLNKVYKGYDKEAKVEAKKYWDKFELWKYDEEDDSHSILGKWIPFLD
jgi:TPR repeat protein